MTTVEPGKYQDLLIELDGGIATVTLNRPDALNSVNARLHRELEMVWADVGALEEARCIILTGSGRAFSAGGDIKAMAAGEFGENPGATLLPGARDLIYRLLSVRQPIVTAINGDCMGLGASMALMTDYVVMAEDARIGDPHVRVGLVAGDGGAAIWPLLVGLSKAKEALMFGKLYTAGEAKEMGLVNEVVPREQVAEAALKAATQLAEGAPLAIQWTKLSLNKILKQVVEVAFDTSAALEMLSFMSRDHKTAANAFITRTKPQFEGK